MSEDGDHVGIVTAKGSRQVVLIDGIEGPVFDEIPPIILGVQVAIEFSPTGGRSAYVGRRGGDVMRAQSMKNVMLQEFVSIDGMAAGPNGSVDYIPAATQGDHSVGERQISFINSIDTILLGRTTYEMFAGYWPNVTSGDDKPFADKLNAIPKVESAAEEVAKLKQGPGKDMVIWGASHWRNRA